MSKTLNNYKTITFKAEIDACGDVFAENKKGIMTYIGKLGESTFGVVPDPYYNKIKKICKKP